MLRATHPIHLTLGLTIWAAWFVVAYGGLSLGCALHPPPAEARALTWINLSLGLVTIGTVALLLQAAGRLWRAAASAEAVKAPSGTFLLQIGAALYLVSAVATLFVGLPLAVLPPCV